MRIYGLQIKFEEKEKKREKEISKKVDGRN